MDLFYKMRDLVIAIPREITSSSPAQEEKFKVLLAEQTKALAAWDGRYGEAMENAAANTRNSDQEIRRMSMRTRGLLRMARTDLQNSFGEQALALLSPEQLQAWEGAKLAHAERLSLRSSQVDLTEQQQDDMKLLAFRLLDGVDLQNPEAIKEVAVKLRLEAMKSVLTNEQAALRSAAIAPKKSEREKTGVNQPRTIEHPPEEPADDQ